MDNNELDILEVFKIFIANLHKIILITLIFSLSFFYIGKIKFKAQYETSTTIMTEKSATDSLNSTYANLGKSNLLVTRVTKDLGLEMSYDEFISKVSVEPVSNTRMIYIKVTDTIPERAADIADKTALELKKAIGKLNNNRVIILDKARISKSPINQNFKKNGVAGFIIGFFVGTLYILIKEFSDKRIKNVRNLEQKFDIPVLGVIPKIKKEN